MNNQPQVDYRREADVAFELAIQRDRLSRLPTAPNYAGLYMYMGKAANGRDDAFKHIDTRQYLPLV